MNNLLKAVALSLLLSPCAYAQNPKQQGIFRCDDGAEIIMRMSEIVHSGKECYCRKTLNKRGELCMQYKAEKRCVLRGDCETYDKMRRTT